MKKQTLFKKYIFIILMLVLTLLSSANVLAATHIVTYQSLGNVDVEKYANQVDKMLKCQDSHITNMFNNDGWRIVFVDQANMNNIMPGASGCTTTTTDPAGPVIYLLADETEVDWSALHEMGHFIAFKSCFIGGTPYTAKQTAMQNEFQRIWIAESQKAGFPIAYSTATPSEFFAQAYDAYLRTPNFKEKCPQTYLFLECCISWAINGVF